MKRAWLEVFTWEMVIAANAALCQGTGALHRPSSDGHERARQLWERQHPQAMWLDEALDLCRQCHRLAPSCNYNGNTFAAIARQLILELPLEADRAHLIRSWAGHIVAGTAEAAETEQFRQFSRSLPDGKKRKKPRTLSALKSQFPIDTPAKPTQRGESRKNQGCTLLAKGAISVL